MVRILKDLDTDIEGRHVLIVEDIIDSGLTLQYLTKNLSSRNPASLEIVTLLSKPSRRTAELPAGTQVSRSRTSSWWATVWTTRRSTATCPSSGSSTSLE